MMKPEEGRPESYRSAGEGEFTLAAANAKRPGVLHRAADDRFLLVAANVLREGKFSFRHLVRRQDRIHAAEVEAESVFLAIVFLSACATSKS